MVINYIEVKSQISKAQIQQVLKLLIEEQCTVPFIARYRKEVTGNLDETQIRKIEELYNEHNEIEKRRKFILETLEKMEVLTPELSKIVAKAETLTELEDIYAPYKSKKKTKGAIARENGLEPLALEIIETSKAIGELEKLFVPTEKVANWEDALEGAKHIIMEKIVHGDNVKSNLREMYKNEAMLSSSVKKDAKDISDYLKFKDYFDFSGPVKLLFSPKSSHRFLAMRRGMLLKILKVSLEVDNEKALEIVKKVVVFRGKEQGCLPVLMECVNKAYKTSLHVSVELEIMTELRKIAEDASIEVFVANLKNLLLAPYLGQKTIMGIDPGIRTGCKVVVISQTGQLIVDFVIYPHEPKNEVEKSAMMLEKVIEKFAVEYIAIGSGTHGRETLAFVEDNVSFVKANKVKATLVSEAGASVYSASEMAIEEFPTKDVTVRGAISIARRFQDPLAELVKIDPKAIGVGQYQHDMNQSKLQKSLSNIVEDCVNYVGVDLNTASYQLLTYISGIGATVAKNISEYRNKHGKFKNRKELLNIGRFSEKIFEQAAGFLRIYGGDNVLDSTFIHPERFSDIEAWCLSNKVRVAELVESKEIQQKFKNDKLLREKLGEHTFNDIFKALTAPAQDPRTTFKSTDFAKNVRSINDLVVGNWYVGVVNNITNFGAFVDIGIKESGLVHISQLADKFVENPLEVVSVGQELKVRVMEIDLERKRVAMSCKSGVGEKIVGGAVPQIDKNRAGNNFSKPDNSETKNNPFAKLKNFKV